MANSRKTGETGQPSPAKESGQVSVALYKNKSHSSKLFEEEVKKMDEMKEYVLPGDGKYLLLAEHDGNDLGYLAFYLNKGKVIIKGVSYKNQGDNTLIIKAFMDTIHNIEKKYQI
jgi:hypothetical protein